MPTEQAIQVLTPQHRVVWKDPDAPREYEVGLWLDRNGNLRTDANRIVVFMDGSVSGHALRCIVRITKPPFLPRVGTYIVKPGNVLHHLVCVSPGEWVGYAPEFHNGVRQFTDGEARDLIEDHGWVVMGGYTGSTPRRGA